jgi:hypothetical protein
MSGGSSTVPLREYRVAGGGHRRADRVGQPFAFDLEVLFADRLATLRHQNRSNDSAQPLPRAAYAPASGKFSREL